MPIINVSATEVNGGNFQFYVPDDYLDSTGYYFDDGYLKWKDRDLPPEQIYKKGEDEGGGGGTLERKQKQRKHEAVSVTTPTFDLKRSESSTFDPRQAIIAHYLDHYSKFSEDEPLFMVHLGFPPYSARPLKDKKDLKDITTIKDRPPIIGYRLMEVLSVDINKNNNQGCVSLYGTIRIKDELEPIYIYNTQREDSESISLMDDTTASLLLNGPPRAISFSDDLFIHLALMEKKNKDDTDNDDDVFYKGVMHWTPYAGIIETFDNDEWGDLTSEVVYKPPSSVFGKLLATTFNGRSGGSVTINYFMLKKGVAANVEVTLVKHGGDHGAAARVYGLIQAGSNCGSVNYGRLLLQKKKETDEYIDVCPGQPIPLSRSLLVVDGSSSLKVSVELNDRLRDTDLSQDDEIIKGTVDFPSQITGTSEKNISGRTRPSHPLKVAYLMLQRGVTI